MSRPRSSPRPGRCIGAILWIATALACGCDSKPRPIEPRAPVVGEGATFPAPLYDIWASRFYAQTGDLVTYSPTGSSQGVEGVLVGRVDFGGSEAPMTAEQVARGGDIVQIPMTLGGIAAVYNTAGDWDGLRLTGDVLADIFLCEITDWSDPRITALNDGAALPPGPIKVIHRSDGSGTTKVFTEYLSRVSTRWRDKVGSQNKVQWPCGTGADGNARVTEAVAGTAGAVGYVSLQFARVARLPTAALRNRAGKFVQPSLDSITAAAAAAVQQPGRGPLDPVLDADGETTYPISTYSFILVRRDLGEHDKAKTLASFLWWAIHDGQGHSPLLHYATLPPEVVAHAEKQLLSLRSKGAPLLASSK